MVVSVSDTGSNTEENIERAVKALGRSKPRVAVFEALYFHKKTVKTVQEIADRTDLSRKAVLTHGKHLVGSGLAIQLKADGDTAYQTIPFYQHHKSKILRLVADPTKLAKLATKRNASVTVVTKPSSIPKRELKKRASITVLYLFANPDPDPDPEKFIRPDAEAKRVMEAVRGSKFRDNVNIEMRPAAGLQTVLDGLNDHSPQVVHFSGHSSEWGVAADSGAIGSPATESLSYDLLAKALASADEPPKIAVFNSCYSAAARTQILRQLPIMIGMTDSVSDTAAVAFATQFYAALASGASVQSAFDQGIVAISAVSLGEADTAKLFTRSEVDPSSFKLT